MILIVFPPLHNSENVWYIVSSLPLSLSSRFIFLNIFLPNQVDISMAQSTIAEIYKMQIMPVCESYIEGYFLSDLFANKLAIF